MSNNNSSIRTSGPRFIPELIVLIGDHLERSTLVRLARVNKTFESILTPYVWREVHGLKPILNLIPSINWYVGEGMYVMTSEPTGKLSRPLEESDWSHVCRYSSMIKRLTIADLQPYHKLCQIIKKEWAGKLLLPNLQSITVDHVFTSTAELLPLFLHRNLVQLSIHRFAMENDCSGLISLVDDIRVHAPFLKELDIAVRSRALPVHWRALSATVNGLLNEMRDLEWVQLRGVPLDAGNLRRIAMLPRLGALSMTGRWILRDDAAQTEAASLCSQSASLAGMDLTVAPNVARTIINGIAPRTLHHLSINLHGSIFSTTDLRLLASTISSALPTLQTLDLSIPKITDLGWDDIRAVLQCKDIRYFSLDLQPTELELLEEDIGEIAINLPKLTSFHLYTRHEIAADVAYRTFILIAKSCPNIRDIHLQIHTSSFTPRMIPYWSTTLNVLDVKSSPIHHTQIGPVARFISGVFPAALVTYSRSNKSPKEWSAVNRLLLIMRQVRVEERLRITQLMKIASI